MGVFTFHNNRWCAKTGSCTQCVQWLADRLLAWKAGVFCTANDLDVQTYRELGRVKKWIQGRGWRIKIGEGEEQGYPFSPRPFPLPGPPPCTSRSRFFFFLKKTLCRLTDCIKERRLPWWNCIRSKLVATLRDISGFLLTDYVLRPQVPEPRTRSTC